MIFHKNIISSTYRFMEIILASDKKVKIKVYGKSMHPFIKERDILTVYPMIKDDIEVGDVVAIRDIKRKKVIIHRIIKKTTDQYLIKGDNCINPDGTFHREMLIGKIKKIERSNKNVSFGFGFEKCFIAYLSEKGWLNTCVIPLMRKSKNIFMKNRNVKNKVTFQI